MLRYLITIKSITDTLLITGINSHSSDTMFKVLIILVKVHFVSISEQILNYSVSNNPHFKNIIDFPIYVLGYRHIFMCK